MRVRASFVLTGLVATVLVAAAAVLPARSQAAHTTHPDAQWCPDAGLGLFLHFDEASVKGINIGWSDIPGRRIAARKETFTPEEVQRIVREDDYNLEGKPWPTTPNQYWALAGQFRPDHYDPDTWLKAAKAAGFEYAVLTTKNHHGAWRCGQASTATSTRTTTWAAGIW